MKYRKKPVVVEAFHWADNDENYVVAVAKWAAEADFASKKAHGTATPHNVTTPLSVVSIGNGRFRLEIVTLEGKMVCNVGDWVICGVAGEFYPCKSDIFAATYELWFERDVP